jgi:ADP-heptose:LPS heptosyltransferase
LKPIEAMGFYASPIPVLNLPDSSHVKRLSGRWLVAHPGSGSEKKNWPEPLWKTFLLEWLKRTDWNILLIGGEAEEQRLGRLAASLPNARCRLVFNLPLVDLALLMRQTQGFLGHDSGMTHLAAALGLRGCVLWGMTNEAVWHPASDRFKVLRADNGLSGLHPETVHLELAQWLGLPPSA